MSFQSSDTKIATEHTEQHENTGEKSEKSHKPDKTAFRHRKSSDETNKSQIVSSPPKTAIKKYSSVRNLNAKRLDQLALYAPDTAGFISFLSITIFFC